MLRFVQKVLYVNIKLQDFKMLNKITTADARKKIANIISRVAYSDGSFVLNRRGEPIAAIVSMKALEMLQEREDRMDIQDAWKAKNEPGEPIAGEELKKELER